MLSKVLISYGLVMFGCEEVSFSRSNQMDINSSFNPSADFFELKIQNIVSSKKATGLILRAILEVWFLIFTEI